MNDVSKALAFIAKINHNSLLLVFSLLQIVDHSLLRFRQLLDSYFMLRPNLCILLSFLFIGQLNGFVVGGQRRI